MIKECIILAGGLGTRLRSVVSDLPKCMASVAEKPFLAYVIEHLQKQGIEKFIFSVGYKHEAIIEFISTQFSPEESSRTIFNSQFSIEEEPLGTGGAIKLACSKTSEKNVLVVNGDTLFSIDVTKLSSFHKMSKSECTLSLKPMQNFDRYGVVELNNDHSVKSFKEKQFYERGLINGGVYAVRVESFLDESLPSKFSFEKDYLEKIAGIPNDDKKIYGFEQNEYFIDIGIPEDYERAQRELR